MMKIYRKWDYDLIVSTAYGTANSIGISLNEKDRDRIEQIVRRFCERTNSAGTISSDAAIVVYNEGFKVKTYINEDTIDYFTIGNASGKYKILYFTYFGDEISDNSKYFIRIIIR